VSWREGEACYCRLCQTGFVNGGKEATGSWEAYRAIPLVDMVMETFRMVSARDKHTVLTTVLPTDSDGKVLPFTVLRDRTGLDLNQVLSSPDAPEYISFEFMWQEWAGVFNNNTLFGPEWVRQAFASQSCRDIRGWYL